VFSDSEGVLIFALDPKGKPTVVICPSQVSASEMINCLVADGWIIQEPTYEAEEDDEDENEERHKVFFFPGSNISDDEDEDE